MSIFLSLVVSGPMRTKTGSETLNLSHRGSKIFFQLRNISEKEAEELIIKRTRNGGISSNKTSKEILILAKVMI